jgi:hypothetical protein
LYLLGSGIYKRIVYASWSSAHGGGLVALAMLGLFAQFCDRLMLGAGAILILLAVGAVRN